MSTEPKAQTAEEIEAGVQRSVARHEQNERDIARALANITPEDIAKALKRPDSFAWFGRKEMFETWSLGPFYVHRDSTLLEQSNADALEKHMASLPDIADDYEINETSNWAVGWNKHMSFRVINEDGTPTRAFAWLKVFNDALASYPVADESDYSRREYEATLENIDSEGHRYVRDGVAKGWAAKVFSWLWDHDQRAVENRDGQGGYPSAESIKTALGALLMLDPEYAVHWRKGENNDEAEALCGNEDGELIETDDTDDVSCRDCRKLLGLVRTALSIDYGCLLFAKTDLGDFTRGYVEAALWSTNDESDESGGVPLDENYDLNDIADEVWTEIIADCAKFQQDNADLLAKVDYPKRQTHSNMEMAGHDFWLTRNGHGAGFGDGDMTDDAVDDALHEACKGWGEINLYVHNGRIYS